MRGIRVNDMVCVATGADKGKRGKVIRVDASAGRVLVEGVNMVFEHVRKSRKNPQGGGRLEREMPVAAANLLLVCPHCDKPTRTARKVALEGAHRLSLRVCKKCHKEIR